MITKLGNLPAGMTSAARGKASTGGARAFTPAAAKAAIANGRGSAPVRSPARPSAPSNSNPHYALALRP
jgi:hypothetical protein